MLSDSSEMPALISFSSLDESRGHLGYASKTEGINNASVASTYVTDACLIGKYLNHLVLVTDYYSLEDMQQICSFYESNFGGKDRVHSGTY